MVAVFRLPSSSGPQPTPAGAGTQARPSSRWTPGPENWFMLNLPAQQLSEAAVLDISTILGLPSIVKTTWVSFRAWLSRSAMLSMLTFMNFAATCRPSPPATTWNMLLPAHNVDSSPSGR